MPVVKSRTIRISAMQQLVMEELSKGKPYSDIPGFLDNMTNAFKAKNPERYQELMDMAARRGPPPKPKRTAPED